MESWTLDPAHTTVEFAVKHMMFTTVRGRFDKVSGTIETDTKNPEHSSVEVEIEASSIYTAEPKRDAHLRSADFIDAEKHPKITFHSKRVSGAFKKPGDRFKVLGDLTIRGTTKEVTLDATFHGMGKDPWGGTRAGFEAHTQIDRSDYGLLWNQALEAGGILVGNEVKILIEAEAVRKSTAERAAA